MSPQNRFESRILLAFISAMAVALGLAAATWTMARSAAQASDWITHTQSVIDSVTRVRSATLQIEFIMQSFRVNGDASQLIDRDRSIADRETELTRLRTLIARQPEQTARWDQLRQLVDQRKSIAFEVERLRRTEGQQAAGNYVRTAPLQSTRVRVYELLADMEREERLQLEKRQHDYQMARDRMVAAGALMAVCLLLTLTATYLLVRRQIRQTESSRSALALSQESLAITLDSIGSGVVVTDQTGRVVRMNPVAEQMTGWTQAEAEGELVDAVVRTAYNDKRPSTRSIVDDALRKGEAHQWVDDLTLLSRQGLEFDISHNVAPLRNAAGLIEGAVLVINNVSELRRAQRTIEQQNVWLERSVAERTAQLHDSESHLASIINSVHLLIAYVDDQRRYVYVNEQYRERFAPDKPKLTGLTVKEVLGDERYAVAEPLIDATLQGSPQSYDWQPFPGVWQNINYVPRRDLLGRIEGYYVVGVDITERKLAEERINQLNVQLAGRIAELEHVSLALRTLSAGNRTMVRAIDKQDLLDSMCKVIVANGDYRFAAVWYCNHDDERSLQLRAQSGYPYGNEALSALRPSWGEGERGNSVVGAAVRTGQVNVVHDLQATPRYAHWRKYLYGAAAGIACPLRVSGQIIGAIAIYSVRPDSFNEKEVELLTELADDLAFGISLMRARLEQQRIQEAMRQLSLHDALTGLPNETQLLARIDAAIDERVPFALLQINIERLREINDALGFSQGDQLLREFGRRLTQAVPADVMSARLRGDEFAVFLPGGNSPGVAATIEVIERRMTEHFVIADIALDVQIKTGVVIYPEHGHNAHDLFRHMDMAVRQAKRLGHPHAVFDPYLDPLPTHRLNFVGELRRAIEGGELELHLQPKISMNGGRLEGAEALVRWKHPVRGMIAPGEFISLAEQTGLIQPLTEWVIDTACKLNETWLSQGCALPVAVNLSARNLREESLLARIRQVHAQWPQGSALLELEITESAAMENPEFSLRALEDLRAQGIKLYIDDFGTGYSSLSYLLKLPVEFIKIDQSFVRNLPGNQDSLRIVRSIIDLAHDLGRKVVAEGVETRPQWDVLSALLCDSAQGYFIARPMPVAQFREWMTNYRPLT